VNEVSGNAVGDEYCNVTMTPKIRQKKTPALALEFTIRVHLPLLYYKGGNGDPEITKK
jgi:hypothetical protein